MHKCLDQVWSVVRGNIKFAWIGVNEHGAKVITRNNFEDGVFSQGGSIREKCFD